MVDMQTVDQFIKALGGTVSVAAALGIAPTTVSSWKSAGSIPKWRIDSLKAVAAAQGKPFPNEFATPDRADAA